MSRSIDSKAIRLVPCAAGLITLGLVLADCGKPNAQDAISAPMQEAPKVVALDASGWQVRERKSTDGAVKVAQSDMPESQRKKLQQEYRQTSLIAIPTEARFNTSLFKINNVPEWSNTVFIAPRIYAYGSAQGGRVAPQTRADGTVSVSFPVVLVDGTRNVIDSPSGSSQINLPASMLMTDISGLRADLNRRFGTEQTLSPLPGCPKKLTFKLNDRELDVTPSDLERADYCQANKPFNVTVNLPEADARYMLEEALYANAVEVRASFETRVSFVSSKASISFDKGKLFRDIEAEIQVNAGMWADVDAHAKVTEIVKNHALSVEIQGDMSPVIQNVVNQAVREFFEPFTPDPKTGLKKCSDALVCLRLNYNYSKQEESFQFKWTQTTTALTGQNYVTWTQLAPLLDKEIVIGDGFNVGGEKRPELSTSATGGFETGLTAVPGDLLEITPSYLIKEERQFDVPSPSTVHNNVCLATEPVYQDLNCPPEYIPRPPVIFTCAHLQIGTRCSQSEDRWETTTSYSYSAPQFVKIDQPIGQMEKIFDGLALRFVYRTPVDGKEKEVTCPLSQFSRKGDGKSLIVRLENRGTCRVFTDDPTIQPMLYLVNRIDYPVNYKVGNEVHLWNGQIPQTPTSTTYHPEVKFAGKVAIRGYSFGSIRSGGQKAP